MKGFDAVSRRPVASSTTKRSTEVRRGWGVCGEGAMGSRWLVSGLEWKTKRLLMATVVSPVRPLVICLCACVCVLSLVGGGFMGWDVGSLLTRPCRVVSP